MTDREKELLSILDDMGDLDAIVVEGYEGVGKGYILNLLSKTYGVTPYRPDYNMWQSHDIRQSDRWKMSGFFWDIFSHFHNESSKLMLFDRGVIIGAVYNRDLQIAKDYTKMIRNMRVLHILVCCDEKTYLRLQSIRDSVNKDSWEKYKEYTDAYLKALDYSGVDYIIYHNEVDEHRLDNLRDTCEGCGHYNYGWCRHPLVNDRVTGASPRCEYSKDLEVQDAPEMQCV